MRTMIEGVLLLSLGAGLAGCSATEPYQRPGEWRPIGANAINLRAMVADPRDLQWGRGGAASSGDLAGMAVARLRNDNVKPLPASAISGLHTTEYGDQQQQSAPSAPGAAPAAPASAGP